VNVEQRSFSEVVLDVSRLVEINDIIGRKVFSKSRFNNTFDDFRYGRNFLQLLTPHAIHNSYDRG